MVVHTWARDIPHELGDDLEFTWDDDVPPAPLDGQDLWENRSEGEGYDRHLLFRAYLRDHDTFEDLNIEKMSPTPPN